MATPPSDSAIKTRIITHMNIDHADSLSLYLQHYGHIPPTHTSPANLTDITLTHLTISHPDPKFTKSGIYETISTTIPISPPLESLSGARKALVSMSEIAQNAINPPGPLVDKVRMPKPFGWFVIVSVALVFVFFSPPLQNWSFPEPDPGSNPHGTSPFTTVLGFNFYPEVIRLLREWKMEFWGIVLGIHLVEAGVMWGKLRRYGVQAGSEVWWAWMVLVMFEGYPSLLRVEAVAKREREKREKKH